MNDKKLLVIIALCAIIIVLLYVCIMFTPLLDDVWKILFVGIIIGFVPGVWVGIKCKGMSIHIQGHDGSTR